MKVHRFFIKDVLLNHKKGQGITLDEVNSKEQIHQIIKVLRLDKSENISIFNESVEYLTEIIEIQNDKRHMSVKLSIKDILHSKEIENAISMEKENSLNKEKKNAEINLYMSFIKKSNFEWVLEKCVELGVHSVIPIISMRTERENVAALTSDNVQMRLEKITIEATEQCGRRDLMIFKKPLSLSLITAQALETNKNKEFKKDTLNLFAHIGATDNIMQCMQASTGVELLASIKQINIYIGPEGGWHGDEIDKMIQADFRPVSLGSLVLRAETAAISAVAIASLGL